MSKKKLSIIIGVVIILIDQFTKILLINKNITIIPNFLQFNYTENNGIAFGMASNNLIIIILFSLVTFGIIIKFLKERIEQIDNKIFIPLILMLSGGISNLIDRIFRGYVIDFIDVNLFDFPNFNIADTVIFISVVLLIIHISKMLFSDESRR